MKEETVRGQAGRVHGDNARRGDGGAIPRADGGLHRSLRLEELGRLTATIAHDFNNLLTVIGGYCTQALDGTEPGSDIRECLEGIEAATRRASALTGKLVAFSREQTPHPVLVDLNELVAGTRDLFGGLLGHDIEVVLRLSREPCPVLVDAVGIERVIMNLVANARDAMPAGGTLTLETSRIRPRDAAAAPRADLPPGDYVTLDVADTGTGMDAATLTRAFEPFFTTKAQGKGTGLGLSSARGIIMQHHGAIACRSEPGNGTRFTVFLPAVSRGSGG